MKSKNIQIYYIIWVIICCCMAIGFLIFRNRILFFIYGYPQSLIGKYNVDLFKAYKKIYLAKIIFLILTILSLYCLCYFSHFIVKLNTRLRTFATVIKYLSIAITLFFMFFLLLPH